MKGKKLSPTQLNVLTLMADGWELGKSTTYDGRTWIQKGGVGRGGETQSLTSSTFIVLYHADMIEPTKPGLQFPTASYCITEAGRKAVTE